MQASNLSANQWVTQGVLKNEGVSRNEDVLKNEGVLKVVACEAQPIVLEGLAKLLAQSAEFYYLGSAQTFPEAMEMVRNQHPDVLMVDESAGLSALLRFVSDVKNTWAGCHPVLWVNQLTEADHLRAIQAGARGILSKTGPVESVIECLRVAGRGDVWMENQPARNSSHGENRRSAIRLTAREKEIVHHVCAGLKNKEIAEALSITAGTVKVHLMHVFEKTGVKDRFELALAGRRLLGLSYAHLLSSRPPTERPPTPVSEVLAPKPFELVSQPENTRTGMLPATVEPATLREEVSVE